MVTVLRGATVVDGTGGPPKKADVAVEGDAVADVGDLGRPSGTDRVVDLDGLVLAPGFIDPHTHYDAQVMWDHDLTPSSWHGVTTAVLGNCGFGVAPTRPEDRQRILRLLQRVEGMTLATLEAGVRWGFETFPDYLDILDATPSRINMAAMLGHTPLRYFVMGEEADERPAKEAEVSTMARLVEEALDAGAVGLSTSRSPGAVGADGKPVPSRVAELSEIEALAGVLGRKQKGTMVAASGPDLGADEFSTMARAIGRPLSWCAVMASSRDPAAARRVVARIEELGDRTVYPQVACQPVVVELTLASPDSFMNIPAFAAARRLSAEERLAAYADPQWRERAYRELVDIRGRLLESAVVCDSRRHPDLVGGPTLGTLAAARGVSPLDVMTELSLAEDLATRFRFVLNNDDEALLAELLANPRLMVGLSDAGAHVTQHCDASYATYLLGMWCRERGVLDLETAVWRLTGQPAAAFGLVDRGRIAPGFRADLVAFDPATVAAGPTERIWDQPGGTDRLVSRGIGIEHVWVNGLATRRDGEDIEGARPGRLLRS